MQLAGSCHCRAVTFQLDSPHPYPFNRCYCATCRKTAGAGGFVVNLSGRAETLAVVGRDRIQIYKPEHIDEATGARRPQERHFCGTCGSPLWVWDPRWPDLLHPYASAIDTPLPTPPELTHLMLAFKPDWVELASQPQDQCFDHYPRESIAEWHERLGLTQD